MRDPEPASRTCPPYLGNAHRADARVVRTTGLESTDDPVPSPLRRARCAERSTLCCDFSSAEPTSTHSMSPATRRLPRNFAPRSRHPNEPGPLASPLPVLPHSEPGRCLHVSHQREKPSCPERHESPGRDAGPYGNLLKRVSRKMLGEVPEGAAVMWHNRAVLDSSMRFGRKV